MNAGFASDIFNQTLIILEDKTLEIASKDLKQLVLPTLKEISVTD